MDERTQNEKAEWSQLEGSIQQVILDRWILEAVHAHPNRISPSTSEASVYTVASPTNTAERGPNGRLGSW